MNETRRDDTERFNELSVLGKIGWWEADFQAKQFLCSEYLCQLLGLEGEILTFKDFEGMIREDYRARISREFMSIAHMEVYDQSFPLYSTKGVVWVNSRLGKKKKQPDGSFKVLGVLQQVDAPTGEQENEAMKQINNLLYRQNSISHSLFHFLKDEDIAPGIYEILQDILDFFHAGRVYIFEYDKEHRHQDCTYEVLAEGVSRAKEMLQKVPVEGIPWWTSQIMAQNPIILETLNDLPDEATGERELLMMQHIKSLMVVPLMANDRIWGFIGVDVVHSVRAWSSEDCQWLNSLANIISICIELRMNKDQTMHAYQALDRSEKLFKNLFTNIPAGVEIYDENGAMVDINNKDMEIFGVADKAEVIGINLFDNPNISPELRERIRTGDVVDFWLDYKFENISDYYSTTKNKMVRLYTKVSKIFDYKGRFTGYALINIDNTERLDAMNRIGDFENFFLLISDYAKVGYAKLNLLDRKGYAIKQWFKNMGEEEDTPLTDVVGRYSRMHPEDRRSVLTFFKKAIAGEEKAFKGEVRILRPGTKDQWNWIRNNVVVNLFEPENGIIELIGINYDITELKETETQLIEAKEKAEMADRLKTAFLANMSHEIRTPLNAIVGFSSLLLQDGDAEERKQYMAIVEENNELLLQLISDILDLSKMEAGSFDFEKKVFDVNLMCQDIVQTMQPKVKTEVEIVFERHLPDCIILNDRNRINQVIANFINNAIKFTSTGRIALGYDRVDETHLRFYVSDTGIGIKREKHTEIFERFTKLDSFVHGTGLGLSISKSIVEQLGGTIGVDSEPGKGSCFWFTVPIG